MISFSFGVVPKRKTPTCNAGAYQETSMRNTEQNSSAIGFGQHGTTGNAHGDVAGANAASKWLAERLGRGTRERFCEIAHVTPAKAAALIKRNTHNRPVVASAVREYADLMASGMWRLTTEGIAISRDGVLINGQHRLLAIIDTGITVPITMWFGVEAEEFKIVDGGRKRTASQILSLEDYPYAANRAALAATLLHMQNSSSSNRAGASNQKVVALAEAMDDAIANAACAAGSAMSKVCNPTAMTLAYWHIATTAPSAARLGEFLDGITTGEALTGPRLQLREWLMNGELAGRNNQNVTVKRAAAIVLAWNAWLAGRKRATSFRWPHFVKLPEAR